MSPLKEQFPLAAHSPLLQGLTTLPGERLVPPSNRNFLGATHASVSHPIPGLPEKLGCGFPVRPCWIWVPAEVLAPCDCSIPAPSPRACLPAKITPHSSGEDLGGQGESYPISLPWCLCHHHPLPVAQPRGHGGGGLQPHVRGAGAPVAPGCPDESGATAALYPLAVLASCSEGPHTGWYLGKSLVPGQASTDCQGAAGKAGMPARATNPSWSLARGEHPEGEQPLLYPQGHACGGTRGCWQ